MFNRLTFIVGLFLLCLLTACSTPAETPTATPAASAQADLAAIKQYATENSQIVKTGSAALLTTAQSYYDLLASYQFDYEKAWAEKSPELTTLVNQAKTHWNTASQHYELEEGIVAGVPVLADYDVWLDAGPSGVEDPENAYQWTLELPNGTKLENPGNFFHGLLEPTIWGTKPEYVGLAVDLDGDGTVEIGEALPEANMFLGTAQAFDQAVEELNTAVTAWQPSEPEAFTALVVMIPTMNEYFEQWKLSTFIAGSAAEETAFIGASRLFDISNILKGLDLTYSNIAVLVKAQNPELDAQIQDGFVDLQGYVNDLYQQEQEGTKFTAEQAELFGTEAQTKATALAGQIAQAAALLNITISE